MSDIHAEPRKRKLITLAEKLLCVGVDRLPQLLPGLLIATFLALFSIWFSEFLRVSILGFEKTPVSAAMLSILTGLVINAAIPMPQTVKPGLAFAVKKILRLGIILLGIRLTIFDVFRLGVYGVPIVLVCILGALFFTLQVSRWLNLPSRLGTLIAVGTSICGVSAIIATAPSINAKKKEVAYAVAVITIFGLLATLFYPYVAGMLFSREPLSIGLFLGTSIHDTSQVVGAAKIYADVFSESLVLDVATVTKLVRNVFMILVIPLIAVYHTHKSTNRDDRLGNHVKIFRLLPTFVVGFLMAAILRSVGDAGVNVSGEAFGLWDPSTWNNIYTVIRNWAGYLLVMALGGVGLSTDVQILKGLGIKPFLVGLGAAVSVGLMSYAAIFLLGSLLVP